MTASTHPNRAAAKLVTPAPDFHALAARISHVSEPSRLCVLVLLGEHERSVGELASDLSCSMTALSRHLTLLRLSGLIVPTRNGQRKIYTLTKAGRFLLDIIEDVIT